MGPCGFEPWRLRDARPSAGRPAAPELWRSGALEELAAVAGWRPRCCAFDFSYPVEYPDEQTLRRLLMAPMGIARLAGPAREEAVRTKSVEALAGRGGAGRGVPPAQRVHYLVATSG